MKRIGTKIALELHEVVTIPTLLYNSETWTINKTEKDSINRAEIQAMKRVLGLPSTTPSAGIVVSTGILFASVRIVTKQLICLQKLLKKDCDNWARITLMALKEQGLGWAKQNGATMENGGKGSSREDKSAKNT